MYRYSQTDTMYSTVVQCMFNIHTFIIQFLSNNHSSFFKKLIPGTYNYEHFQLVKFSLFTICYVHHDILNLFKRWLRQADCRLPNPNIFIHMIIKHSLLISTSGSSQYPNKTSSFWNSWSLVTACSPGTNSDRAIATSLIMVKPGTSTSRLHICSNRSLK